MAKQRTHRRLRLRRIIAHGVVFLLLGAVVNVAVAWGCVYCRPAQTPMAKIGGKEVFSTLHSPLVMISLDFGTVETFRIWRLTSTSFSTGLQSISILSPTEFQERLPTWSFLRETLNREDFAAKYGFPEDITTTRESAAGWPAMSLRGAKAGRSDSQPPVTSALWELPTTTGIAQRSLELPLRPVWPAFAFNTIFYAAILWLLFVTPFKLRNALRRMRRIKRGRCPACGYPVGESPVCTECGAGVTSRGEISISRWSRDTIDSDA